MTLLARLRKRRKKRFQLEEILSRATDKILTDSLYLNKDLKCNDVAKAIGTNRTYLWKALGKHRLGFQEYLSKFRVRYFIENARGYCHLQGAEIAERCGFNNPKFLSKYLKQLFGISLSDYMKLVCRGL